VPLVVAARIGGEDRGVVIVDRDSVGKVTARRIEVERDRMVVDATRAALRQQTLEDRQGIRCAAGVRQTIEGRDHIRRGHLTAVVKTNSAPQFERPYAAVRVVGPALRQHRLQRQVGLRDAEELGHLEYQLVAAAVVDEQRVDGAVRHGNARSHTAAAHPLPRGRRRGESIGARFCSTAAG